MIFNPMVSGGGGGGLKVVAHGTATATEMGNTIDVPTAIFALVISTNADPCLALRGTYIVDGMGMPIKGQLSDDGSQLTVRSPTARAVDVEYWAIG